MFNTRSEHKCVVVSGYFEEHEIMELLKLTLVLAAMSARCSADPDSAVSDSTTPMTFKLPASMSCQGHCGKDHVSCACDVTCEVYRNCCEDFRSECPQVADTARRQLGHMTGSDVTCVRENVFVVSGCPSGVSFSEDWEAGSFPERLERKLHQLFSAWMDGGDGLDTTSEHCWTAARDYFDTLMTSRQMSRYPRDDHLAEKAQVLLLDQLSQLYVSDKRSGFVFANLGVFLCYAKPGAVPCLWQFHAHTSYSKPLDKILTQPDYHVFTRVVPSSELIPYDTLPVCNNLTKDECDPTSVGFTKHLQERCKSFISTVQSVKNPWSMSNNYRNRFCLQCMEGHPHISVDRNPRPRAQLPRPVSTLVAVGQRLLQLHVNVSYALAAPPAWINATCYLNGRLSCHVDTCNTGFLMRPSGVCKQLNKVQLAVYTGQHHVDNTGHQSLADLLLCLLASGSLLDVAADIPPELTKYNISGHVMHGAHVSYYEEADDQRNIQEQMAVFSQGTGNVAAYMLHHAGVYDDVRGGKIDFGFNVFNVQKSTNDNTTVYQYIKHSHVRCAPSLGHCEMTSFSKLRFCSSQITSFICYFPALTCADMGRSVGTMQKDKCWMEFRSRRRHVELKGQGYFNVSASVAGHDVTSFPACSALSARQGTYTTSWMTVVGVVLCNIVHDVI